MARYVSKFSGPEIDERLTKAEKSVSIDDTQASATSPWSGKKTDEEIKTKAKFTIIRKW